MTARPPRRFTIADVMILVAAVALGAFLARAYLPGFSRMMQFGSLRSVSGFRRQFLVARGWLSGPGSCVVVPLMLATIALRLRRPRPPWRRLMRQPGFVACIAAAVSLLPGVAWYLAIAHRPGFQRPGSFDQTWMCLHRWTNGAVLGAWLALVLARRWRPEPSWVDRWGLALGSYWVVLTLVGLGLPWAEKIIAWSL